MDRIAFTGDVATRPTLSPSPPARILCASGTTSGYQLLQRLGVGIGLAAAAITSGTLLGVANASGQLTSAYGESNTLAHLDLAVVARALDFAGVADKYLPVEWLIGDVV